MAYTQPTTKTAGDPTLASDWNNYVRANFIALRSLLPDPGASNLPLVSSSTSVAAFGQLGTAGIATGAITADRLATSAVTSAAIATSAVTSAALASAAVTRAKLAVVEQTPYGAVQMYAGASAPTGWLLCQGQSVSQATYADLFAVVGTTYGTGSGAGQFSLPNLVGRFPQGAGTGYALAASGGSATLANHTHTMPDHNHSLPQHTHRVAVTQTVTSGSPSSTNGGTSGTTQYANANHTHQVTINTDPQSDNNATGTNVGNKTSFSSDSSGGGGENRPPFLTLNFIIYAGV